MARLSRACAVSKTPRYVSLRRQGKAVSVTRVGLLPPGDAKQMSVMSSRGLTLLQHYLIPLHVRDRLRPLLELLQREDGLGARASEACELDAGPHKQQQRHLVIASAERRELRQLAIDAGFDEQRAATVPWPLCLGPLVDHFTTGPRQGLEFAVEVDDDDGLRASLMAFQDGEALGLGEHWLNLPDPDQSDDPYALRNEPGGPPGDGLIPALKEALLGLRRQLEELFSRRLPPLGRVFVFGPWEPLELDCEALSKALGCPVEGVSVGEMFASTSSQLGGEHPERFAAALGFALGALEGPRAPLALRLSSQRLRRARKTQRLALALASVLSLALVGYGFSGDYLSRSQRLAELDSLQQGVNEFRGRARKVAGTQAGLSQSSALLARMALLSSQAATLPATAGRLLTALPETVQLIRLEAGALSKAPTETTIADQVVPARPTSFVLSAAILPEKTGLSAALAAIEALRKRLEEKLEGTRASITSYRPLTASGAAFYFEMRIEEYIPEDAGDAGRPS